MVVFHADRPSAAEYSFALDLAKGGPLMAYRVHSGGTGMGSMTSTYATWTAIRFTSPIATTSAPN